VAGHRRSGFLDPKVNVLGVGLSCQNGHDEDHAAQGAQFTKGSKEQVVQGACVGRRSPACTEEGLSLCSVAGLESDSTPLAQQAGHFGRLLLPYLRDRGPALTQNFDTRVAHRFAGGEPA
jgi:hypothetical protein